MQTTPNIERITKVLSELLSDKHGAKITITAVRKDGGDGSQEKGGAA